MEPNIPRKLRNLPIAQKIALPFSLFIIAIAVFINLYFPARREYQAKKDLNSRIEFISRACAVMVSPPLYFHDQAQVQKALLAFNETPDLLYIVITDSAQNMAGSIRRQNAYRYDYIATAPKFNENLSIMKARFPIEFSGKKIGDIYLGLETSALKEDLQNIRLAVSIISGFIILLGVGVIIITSQLITKPLREIAVTAGAVSQGDLSKRSPVIFNDEVGELATAFNTMVQNLQNVYAQVSELNKTLETRIIERTRSLQEEINEHRQTEEALRKSQQQLLREQKIFIGGPTIVYRINISAGYVFEYVSANIEQFGFTASEMVGEERSFFSLLLPKDAERFKREAQAAALHQNPHFESSFAVISKSGEQRYIYNFSKHVNDPAQQATHIDGYMIDITAGKKAELALVESEIRFKTIFESAGVGIATVSLEGKFLEANNAFLELVGYSMNELRDKSFMSVSHPDDLQKEIERFGTGLEAQHEEAPFRSEKRFLHKSGRIVWGRLTSTFVRSAEGTPIFGVGMVEDITVKRQAEALAIQQNLLLNSLAESLRILLTTEDYAAALQQALARLGTSTKTDRVILYENTTSSSGHIIAFNRFEWRKNFELPAPADSYLNRIDLTASLPKWLEVFARKESVSGALEFFTEAENAGFIRDRVKSIYLAPLFLGEAFWGILRFDDCLTEGDWNEGKRSFIHTAASSIAAHIGKEAARLQLVHAKEKALESDRLKSTLFSNMSHEFRTPMNGILGYAEMLAELLQDDEKRSMAENITGSALRLMRTISSVLDLAQLESGAISAQPRPVDTVAMLRSIIAAYKADAAAKNLRVELVVRDEEVRAIADYELLEKAVGHIIHNAIRFTNIGGVTVTVDSKHRGKLHLLVLSVQDSGIGISPEMQETVYKEFRQASEGMGRGYEGSGLGLAIAKRIIELFSGEIKLKSELGVGSTFVVVLPAVPFMASDKQIVREQEIPAKAPAVTSRRYKALIVEDNPANADITKLFIRSGFDTQIALSGPEGLQWCHEEKFDVVLMDINLGTDIDGVQTFRLLREIPGYEHIPVVALTGFAMAGDKEHFLEIGFDAYLAKPFDKKKIMALLDALPKERSA